MLGLGDEDAAERTLVGDLELVEPLDVEGQRAARAVDLERVVVDPPSREPGGLERPDDAVLELDGRGERVVDLVALDERLDDGGHGHRLADEVAADVDDVGAEVAERARSRGLAVEAPARRRVDSPGLEVARAEVEEVAEVARLEHLARKADGGDEAVVEAAHVHDAGALGLAPDLERLVGRAAERLLAEDVLAVARGGDGRLRVERVRPAVVEEADALVRDLLAPVGDRLGPAELPARGLDLVGRAPGEGDELGCERRVERPGLAERARVGLAHEGIAEHADADALAGRHTPPRAARRRLENASIEHRAEQDEAGDHELRPGRQAEQVHAVLDRGDHERPEERRDDAADAAEEARAADDRGGDDEQEQVPTARAGSDRAEPRGQHDPTDARHEAADHEDGDAYPIDVDARRGGPPPRCRRPRRRGARSESSRR